MRAKKLSALLLAFLIALSLTLPAQAAANQFFGRGDYRAAAQAGLNYRVEARRTGIEQRYGIRIRYDVDPNGAASIGTGALATLDTVLGYLTPDAVRQLSDYWEARTGNRLTFAFVYSPFQHRNSVATGEVLGSFNPRAALIELYIPAFDANVFISGESPLTIMHEVGHAVHLMMISLHGEERLHREWTALNRSAQYVGRAANVRHDPSVFVSSIAAVSYEEDFAETFAHAFVRRNAGQGFSHQLRTAGGGLTPLGRKVNFLEELLALHFGGNQQMLANYRRVWTAPIVLEHSGLRLSGDYLQYIGFTHPRFVLRSLVSMLDIEMESYEWVSPIGGWIITDTAGVRYTIFPGGAAFFL